jgi:putative ABC transport system substrate-binding protein
LLLLCTAMTAPRALRAQQKAMPVIGYLSSTSPGSNVPWVEAFRQGLQENGYVEGQNVAIEYRWAEGRYDRLPALAVDLLGRKIDLIAASSIPSALAAKEATSSVPIVFVSGGDPVELGLVASLARPGGNVTGVSILAAELAPKRLELLAELVPQARVIALLVNPSNPQTEGVIRDVQEAAQTKGVQLHILKVGTESDTDAAFASLVRLPAGGLVVGTDPFFTSRSEQIVALASRHAVPAIYTRREFAAWRPDQLRNQPRGRVSPSRHLRRKDPQRCQTGRSARPAADDIRAGRQSEDRQRAGPDDPALDPRPRRRGHRMISRRDILLGVAMAAAGWRAGAEEAPKNAHIGFIVTGGRMFPRRWFDEAMGRLGWIEGRNLVVDRRVTGEDPEQRKTAAAELIAANPDIIVAAGMIDALPVRAPTRTIPIVVINGNDLVETGLADSLARPGGNVTGMTLFGSELDGKRLELLRELVPEATRISVFAYARSPRTAPRITAIEALARPLGIRVVARLVSKVGEFEGAFAASAADHDEAMLVQESPVAHENLERIVALAAQYRLPAVYDNRQYIEAGGLAFYGQVWRDNFERAAALVDKILKGAKPADLPIEQPTKFELVVNAKTAQVLGVTIPQSILARADEVIE